MLHSSDTKLRVARFEDEMSLFLHKGVGTTTEPALSARQPPKAIGSTLYLPVELKLLSGLAWLKINVSKQKRRYEGT